MQRRYYKAPAKTVLQDATTLYKWVIGPKTDSGKLTSLKNGHKVRIIGNSSPPVLPLTF